MAQSTTAAACSYDLEVAQAQPVPQAQLGPQLQVAVAARRVVAVTS